MRAGGILLPIFSLPSKYGIGCLSKEAYEFVDFLAESKQKYWQILPLGPTSFGDSPYQSFSTFAGNPYFISLESLNEQGLLTEEECDSVDFGDDETKVDYAKLYEGRFRLLRKAYVRSKIYKKHEFFEFKKENAYWLRDYALFMALKDWFHGVPFIEWPEDIRKRYGYAMDYYQKNLYYDIEFYEYLQYEFYRQWFSLKKYANEKGIQIIGDIPIYVAYDSADLWARPELFQLDDDLQMQAVAGCPPDGFSKNGQLWGNPLYRWDYHRDSNFDWWIKRIEKCATLYDVTRIDHFRGFDQYYAIPAGDKNACNGQWENGPGNDLFLAIRYCLGPVNIIAEDLGYITDSVRKLVRDTGFPNMKVLEFAFDSRESDGAKEYLPYNYDTNCVVYTGTHDNETLMSWSKTIQKKEVKQIQDYVGKHFKTYQEVVEEMLRLAIASSAKLCVIPIQDYLGLGDEARINTPSTLGGNWKWRLREGQLTPELARRIGTYMTRYGRN